jgi:putative endonuclease
VTNDLDRRLYEHKNQIIKGFTSKYQIDSLVYFESFVDVNEAIVREKEIKKWRREKKDALIESMNSDWEDISVRWGGIRYYSYLRFLTTSATPFGRVRLRSK